MSRILINDEVVQTVPERLFDRDEHGADALISRRGRGAVVTFRHEGRDMILKRYYRGGLPGRLLTDTYLYTGLERTRMWREFRMLAAMGELGLPVPTPVAARCRKSSPITYRGDLIMIRINDATTLAESISNAGIPLATWSRIGAVVARFHQNRVFHRDLNAYNILLTPKEEIYLIDFDKCYFERTPPSRGWPRSNLDRLRKSLRKLDRQPGTLHFEESDWQAFEEGYASHGTSH